MNVSPMILLFSSGSDVRHKNFDLRLEVVPSGPFSVMIVSPFRNSWLAMTTEKQEFCRKFKRLNHHFGREYSLFFKKMGLPRPHFIYFHLYKTNTTIFTTNKSEKTSIQYTALGFEPKTLEHESPPITTRPGHLPIILTNFVNGSITVHG